MRRGGQKAQNNLGPLFLETVQILKQGICGLCLQKSAENPGKPSNFCFLFIGKYMYMYIIVARSSGWSLNPWCSFYFLFLPAPCRLHTLKLIGKHLLRTCSVNVMLKWTKFSLEKQLQINFIFSRHFYLGVKYWKM